jgi:hypothetical protein
MKDGLIFQAALLEQLRDQGKVRIETLESSGLWFRKNFPLTPATAVTALNDYQDKGNKTVWYNSRFYRVNLIWEGASFRFRDIHLFDERLESRYLTQALTSAKCVYTTLPLVDGFHWSTIQEKAGLRIVDKDGKNPEVLAPVVSELPGNVLKVSFSTVSGQDFEIIFNDDRFEVRRVKGDGAWALELKTAAKIRLPFEAIGGNRVTAKAGVLSYGIECKEGVVEKAATDAAVFRIQPTGNRVVVDCGKRDF